MDDKVKKTILWGLSAAFAAAMAVFQWVGEPSWWQTLIGLVGVIVPFILGKPWSPPAEP